MRSGVVVVCGHFEYWKFMFYGMICMICMGETGVLYND